ncbi:MerR family transcriptional regulator [Prevotella multiformis]|uniref:MerR family transcriptional regulator n=1 Tax=Prevotella multiformis TaxID=282402 RepID=UPI0028DD2443|nr:MerR family transcriptional regulator [Prevotella multiformis]
MDKGIRNKLLGVWGTVIIAFVGTWVQLNSRLSILEVQVDNYHLLHNENNRKAQEGMEEIKDKLDEINVKFMHLNDVKMGRPDIQKGGVF